MSTDKATSRYLRRQHPARPWQLEGLVSTAHEMVGAIVIPALAEGADLQRTLESLAACDSAAKLRFLVTVIVNNREDAPPGHQRQNQQDLAWLRQLKNNSPLQLSWIDAASEGLTLSRRQGGVGLARKIACDLLLPVLSSDALLVHLDADCLVAADYLCALFDAWSDPSFDAGVIAYAHQPAATPALENAICRYELYLRCHMAGLQLAGSPYAYHSIGSTMVSRCRSYVAAGGMPVRQAGEDFYFLQQLAKTTTIRRLCTTRVYPSARLSCRTPFGTGQSLRRDLDAEHTIAFHPVESYDLLGQWLTCVQQHLDEDASMLLTHARKLHPKLEHFLHQEKFAAIWPNLQRTHQGRERRWRAFHEWFDALKTWKLIHCLERKPAPGLSEHSQDPCGGHTADVIFPTLFERLSLTFNGSLSHALEQLRLLQDSTTRSPACNKGPDMSSDTPQQPAAEQRLALRSVIIIQKIRLDDGRRTFFGYSTNISCSGLFVSTVSPANPGSRFHLEFTLPTPLNEMVRCDCEVVWNRHFSENSPFEPGMGLRFIDLEEEIRIRIDDWIRQATAE